MRIAECEILRLRIPFRSAFSHAEASREASDTIYIALRDDDGNTGLGEVLARSYLSGETNDEIFASRAERTGVSWLGVELDDVDDVLGFLARAREDGLEEQPALYGGFEGALFELHLHHATLDFAKLVGPPRVSRPGRCETIGFEVPYDGLRARVMKAQLAGATVVKVKVGAGAEDSRRLARIDELFGGKKPLRLDANGTMDFAAARQLLADCRALRIESFEQPLAAGDPDLAEKLRALHEESGVALMADESVCGAADARRWAREGGYQLFNVRVGKCGGLTGAVRVMEEARRADIDMVGGTLVGESAVLEHLSEVLLAHSEDLPYVEGLGQSTYLLALDPVAAVEVGGGTVHRLREDLPAECIVGKKRVAA